ncbi:MAG: AarF/ABC1/UbiB kinase family protein [Pirellulaceae bacterium]|nr:AarF/ABC1/UbiB kinase family protein [Pirellulaceae bacterium]
MLQLAKNAGQYVELAKVLFRHGRGELATILGLDAAEQPADESSTPESLARDIEKLGPAYIKLAQIASTREDMISADYIEALSRLQDDVEPVAAEDIRNIIREELGVGPDKLFAQFDDSPLACASLGQVHRATLRDGREVVVKVQRPDVAEDAKTQLAALRDLAKIADSKSEIGRKFRFCTLVDAVDYAMSLELDYRTEAANLLHLKENLREFDSMRVPEPIESLVTRRVLVMEKLTGSALKDVSGVVLNEIDTESMAHDIIEAYLQQILVDGLFHADPHPGNLLLTADHKLGLIDGGMVVSVSPKFRRRMGAVLIAISEREGEEAARLVTEIGRLEDGASVDELITSISRIIARQDDSPTQTLSPGKTIVQLLNVAGEKGLVLPFELVLYSKALLQMENTVFRLCPDIDLRQIVRSYSTRLLAERTGEQLSLGQIARSALDSVELASELPRRLNRITELVSENALRVTVDAVDEQELLAGIHKIANRITAGLVTTALIISASLLMRVDAGPMLFGFPALATIFFLIAALIGFYLVWLALVKDA